MSKSRTTMDKRTSQLPGWLWPTSNTLPPLYKRIWEAVKEDKLTVGAMAGELLVDTNKVFPLLLTSQLPTEVLGYIWSLANQKYAGQLTEQELYIVLALIAIAQTSYAFNNLEVLHMLPGPPIPRLNLNILQPSVPQVPSVDLGDDKQDNRSYMNTYSTTIIPSSLISTSYIGEAKIDPTPTNNIATDFSDDFCDFQSAPIPSTPSVPMWDSKQGSAIGSRLANHNLSGSKKLVEKKKINTIKNNHSINSIRNISINNSPQLIKERSPERLFPKCNLKNQPKTVILKDTVIRSEPIINYKEIIPDKHPEIVKISKISSPKPIEASTNDLMNLATVEDKYSALRVLVEDPELTPVTSLSPEPSLDDFGDFISAEQPELTNLEIIDTSLDLFSDFEQFLPSANDKSQISFTQETIEAFAQLEITASPEKTINFLEEKYEVTIDPEKVIAKDNTVITESNIELNNGNNTTLNRSGSVPSLDLKCFLPTTVDDDKERESMNQLIYWEWKQYMESCVLLLQVAANIFTSITSEVVLAEVLNSAQGYNFLCNLAEVAAVCRRVNFSHKEMDINIMGFDDLLMEIDRIWAEMEPYYVSIPVNKFYINLLFIKN